MAVFEKKLILACFVLLVGCYNKVQMNVLDKEELKEVFSKEKEFILELSKDECPYCIMINEKERGMNTYNRLPEYKYILPAECSEADVSELEKYLEPLKYVPCFYHIKDGEVVSYMFIRNWQNPENELEMWLNNQ